MEDKRSILALIIIGAVLLLTPTYMKLINPPVESGSSAADSLSTGEEALPPVSAPGIPESITPEQRAQQIPSYSESEIIIPAPDSIEFEGVTIETPLFTADIGLLGAALRGWTLQAHEREGEPPISLIPPEAMGAVMELPIDDDRLLVTSTLFTTDAPDMIRIDAGDVYTITLTAQLDDERRVTRHMTFNGDRYDFNITDTFFGFETSPVNDGYRLMWLGGLSFTETSGPTITEKDRQRQDKLRREELMYSGYYAYQGGDVQKTKLKKDSVSAQAFGTVDWVALRVKYFTAIMIPEGEPFRNAQMNGSAGSVGPAQMNVATDRRLPTGEGSAISTNLYLGPIDYRILRSYERDLDKMMDFGFSIIKPISRGVLLLFTFLHTIIPNYGLVIIIFSILVKIVVFPLTRKSYESMHAMQELSPKMAEIRAKYKDDSEKMNKKIMNLYKENKVNPLGGCFPMLLQMPIFWALFIVFRTTIELRGEPFMLWITDLSLADPYLVLPGLMAVTMLIQQRAQLKDPKQRPMALMMPAVLFFVFRTFPAGLILYWTLFNVFSVLQTEFMHGKSKPETAPAK